MGEKGEINLEKENNKIKHQKTAHDKWKEGVKSRKCNDFSKMSYWQMMSTCNQL